MAKKESSFINMAIALFVITSIAGVALATVYDVTKGPIELSRIAKINAAIRMVVPDFDTISDTILKPENEPDNLIIHRLIKSGEPTGNAVETYTTKGFTGKFTLMVGFKPDGSINNIEVLDHKETPGLGTKMASPNFKNQFKGINISEIKGGQLKVKKDGGTIDAITAATISSRAFCDAVNRADAINRKGGKQ